MNYNPFIFFEKKVYYRLANFSKWLEMVFRSLAGTSNDFGLLDYLLVLPGLLKFVRFRFRFPIRVYYGGARPSKLERIKSLLWSWLLIFSDCLDVFQHLVALVLILVFTIIPLTYTTYYYITYKSRQLKNSILEMEVLPVDKKKLMQLEYYHFCRKTFFIRPADEKLLELFDGKNRPRRIKLKSYLESDEIKHRNMENYWLSPICMVDKEKKNVSRIILGVFPFPRDNSFNSEDNPPAMLIIPSKKNQKAIKAMQAFNAFNFSIFFVSDDTYYFDRGEEAFRNNMTTNDFLDRIIKKWAQQEDYFKQAERLRHAKRHTALFALEQAASAAINPSVSKNHPLRLSINALLPSMLHFANMDVQISKSETKPNPFNLTPVTLTSADAGFIKRLAEYQKSHTPKTPYLDPKLLESKTETEKHSPPTDASGCRNVSGDIRKIYY
jgi:hypothetical protein